MRTKENNEIIKRYAKNLLKEANHDPNAINGPNKPQMDTNILKLTDEESSMLFQFIADMMEVYNFDDDNYPNGEALMQSILDKLT